MILLQKAFTIISFKNDSHSVIIGGSFIIKDTVIMWCNPSIVPRFHVKAIFSIGYGHQGCEYLWSILLIFSNFKINVINFIHLPLRFHSGLNREMNHSIDRKKAEYLSKLLTVPSSSLFLQVPICIINSGGKSTLDPNIHKLLVIF